VSKPRIALFDLDHTLLPIDSDYSWGEFTQQIGWTDPVAFKRRNEEFFEHYKALEPGKWVKTQGWGGPAEALDEIRNGIAAYARRSGAARPG